MEPSQRDIDEMRFLGYKFVFACTQPMLYKGVQTRVLDSQILAAKRVAEILREEQKYDGKAPKGTSISEAARISRLHRDISHVLDKCERAWRDKLPLIIETVESSARGESPNDEEVKHFFREMLSYIDLKIYQLQPAFSFP